MARLSWLSLSLTFLCLWMHVTLAQKDPVPNKDEVEHINKRYPWFKEAAEKLVEKWNNKRELLETNVDPEKAYYFQNFANRFPRCVERYDFAGEGCVRTVYSLSTFRGGQENENVQKAYSDLTFGWSDLFLDFLQVYKRLKETDADIDPAEKEVVGSPIRKFWEKLRSFDNFRREIRWKSVRKARYSDTRRFPLKRWSNEVASWMIALDKRDFSFKTQYFVKSTAALGEDLKQKLGKLMLDWDKLKKQTRPDARQLPAHQPRRDETPPSGAANLARLSHERHTHPQLVARPAGSEEDDDPENLPKSGARDTGSTPRDPPSAWQDHGDALLPSLPITPTAASDLLHKHFLPGTGTPIQYPPPMPNPPPAAAPFQPTTDPEQTLSARTVPDIQQESKRDADSLPLGQGSGNLMLLCLTALAMEQPRDAQSDAAQEIVPDSSACPKGLRPSLPLVYDPVTGHPSETPVPHSGDADTASVSNQRQLPAYSEYPATGPADPNDGSGASPDSPTVTRRKRQYPLLNSLNPSRRRRTQMVRLGLVVYRHSVIPRTPSILGHPSTVLLDIHLQ